jgi:hypothetical protein
VTTLVATPGASPDFTTVAINLTPGTVYSFRAFATNSSGTGYTSPVSSFVTYSIVPQASVVQRPPPLRQTAPLSVAR